jgi:hypothetical protein
MFVLLSVIFNTFCRIAARRPVSMWIFMVRIPDVEECLVNITLIEIKMLIKRCSNVKKNVNLLFPLEIDGYNL